MSKVLPKKCKFYGHHSNFESCLTASRFHFGRKKKTRFCSGNTLYNLLSPVGRVHLNFRNRDDLLLNHSWVERQNQGFELTNTLYHPLHYSPSTASAVSHLSELSVSQYLGQDCLLYSADTRNRSSEKHLPPISGSLISPIQKPHQTRHLGGNLQKLRKFWAFWQKFCEFLK